MAAFFIASAGHLQRLHKIIYRFSGGISE